MVVYLGVNADFDAITQHYTLIMGRHSPGDGFWYVETLAHHSNNDGTIETGIQIAHQYLGSRMAQRQRFENGAWSAWAEYALK